MTTPPRTRHVSASRRQDRANGGQTSPTGNAAEGARPISSSARQSAMTVASSIINHVIRRLPGPLFIAVLATAAITLLLTFQAGLAEAQTPSDNTTLSSVTVDGTTVPGFSSERVTAHYGVPHDTSQVTVAGTAEDTNATIGYGGADADADTTGHQVALSAGSNTVTITVTAEDTTSTESWTIHVNRGVSTLHGWKASDDFDTLIGAGNDAPFGIWSDGTTMWVADDVSDKIFAYNTDTKARDPDEDFDTLDDAGNNSPAGIWSNGTTMWVGDLDDTKLYAYNLSTKDRDADKDIDLSSFALVPVGLWSDGETMWMSSGVFIKILAVNLSTKDRDEDKEFSPSGLSSSVGIWSDGETIWVTATSRTRIFAYDLSAKTRDRSKEYTNTPASGNAHPYFIWSDGGTMWVVDYNDDKIYSYVHRILNDDATLSGITVDGTAITGFAADTTSYRRLVEGDVTQITVAATTTDDNATWEITPPADADTGTDGHQVDIAEGVNAITIRVTADNGTDTRDYTLNVVRPSTAYFDWKQTEDFNTLAGAGNNSPYGIWSDGTTMWVADVQEGKLYGYNLSTKARDMSKDLDEPDSHISGPRGIWSDGTTMWVSAFSVGRLYAFDLATDTRDASKDFDTLSDAGNEFATAFWSDGSTMWVVDSAAVKVFAYNMATKARDPDKDINSLDDAGNLFPSGAWSDGATLWISDADHAKIYAYRLSDGVRDAEKDFDTLRAAGNSVPRDIWSDGITMWVADSEGDKIFSYNLSRPGVFDLTFLGLNSEELIEGFDSDKTSYEEEYEIQPSNLIHVHARPRDADAHLAYNQHDFFPDVKHLVMALNEGHTTLTITVTIDGNPTYKTYTIHLSLGDVPANERTSAWAFVDPPGPPAVHTRGTISASGDVDAIRFAFKPDQLYEIILKGAAYGNSDRTLTLPTLSLARPVTIRNDPLTGEPLTNLIRTVILIDGTFSVGDRSFSGMNGWARTLYTYKPVNTSEGSPRPLIIVRGFDPEDTGTYDVQVRELTDAQYPNDASGATDITPGASIGGRIDYAFDGDWFRASGLTPGAQYVVEARGGPIYHLIRVYDEHSNAVEDIPNGYRFVFTPESDQDYFFKVYGFPHEIRGIYRLYIHQLLTITGTATVESTLSVDASEIHDPDGTTRYAAADAWKYRWFRVDSTGNQRRIRGADASSYTVTDDDINHQIKARICYRDDRSRRNEECRFSGLTQQVPDVSTQTGNQPATGLPTVSGTINVGDTITADVSSIADEDGLENVAYTYQWLADNVAITDATSASYTLTRDDFGKAVTVRVSFTDDAGNEEILTSGGIYPVMSLTEDATNTPATGQPSISGTPQVGETVTADTSGIADEDGLENAAYSHQWLGDDVEIAGATADGYTLTSNEEGKAIKVRVTFTDDAGNEETLTSAATSAVAPKAPAAPTNLMGGMNADGSITITWTAPQDDTVTGYEILRRRPRENEPQLLSHVQNTGSAETAYTDTDTGQNTLYVYCVKAINVSGAGPRSNYVNVERYLNFPATGQPTISGTARAGETLTAGTSGIADEDGLENVSYSYQWLAGDAEIAGATGSSYALTDSEEGKAIKVRVTFTDDAGNEETLTSAATAAVSAAPAANSPPTGQPVTSGTAQVGETLSTGTSGIADEDGLGNATFAYQWIRNDGTADSDIQDATGSTYTLTPDDEGNTIKVRVSFTDDRDNNESLTSDATATVSAAPAANTPATGAPEISGRVRVGETLTAGTSGIAEGLTGVFYSYQWVRNDGNAESDIEGATDSTYTLGTDEEGKTIKVRVTFTDDANNEEALTSQATDAVAPLPPLTVSVTTSAPAAHDGSAEFTFELRFSEEPHADFSYKTLRDHAFTVTGGEVIEAKRLDRPSNIHWQITVEPDGNGDVTLALPVTTDCGALGAVCTGDGRKLSNRLEFTVSGPGG